MCWKLHVIFLIFFPSSSQNYPSRGELCKPRDSQKVKRIRNFISSLSLILIVKIDFFHFIQWTINHFQLFNYLECSLFLHDPRPITIATQWCTSTQLRLELDLLGNFEKFEISKSWKQHTRRCSSFFGKL